VHAVAVEGAGADLGDVAVEDFISIFGQFDAGLSVAVEQADLDLGGIGGKQCEIGTPAVPVRAQRIRQAFFDRSIRHDCPICLVIKCARQPLRANSVAVRCKVSPLYFRISIRDHAND
jgi:hypothetical protein